MILETNKSERGFTMDIIKTKTGKNTKIELVGRLDTITAPELQAVLIPEFDNIKEIELDLKDLAYISSAGLRILLIGEKTAKASDGKFIISNVSDEIMEVFEMTGFSEILTII